MCRWTLIVLLQTFGDTVSRLCLKWKVKFFSKKQTGSCCSLDWNNFSSSVQLNYSIQAWRQQSFKMQLLRCPKTELVTKLVYIHVHTSQSKINNFLETSPLWSILMPRSWVLGRALRQRKLTSSDVSVWNSSTSRKFWFSHITTYITQHHNNKNN